MNILENYRGLKYYAPFRQESAEDIENRRLHGRDTSCCTLLFLILLLSLTIFVVSERRDVNTEF